MEWLPVIFKQDGTPLRAEGAGAGLEVFLERPAKCGRCLVAGGQGNLRHRITAEYQPAGRPFEANAAHVVARWLTQIGGEDAMESETAKSRPRRPAPRRSGAHTGSPGYRGVLHLAAHDDGGSSPHASVPPVGSSGGQYSRIRKSKLSHPCAFCLRCVYFV